MVPWFHWFHPIFLRPGSVGGQTWCGLCLRSGWGEHVSDAPGRSEAVAGAVQVLFRGRVTQISRGRVTWCIKIPTWKKMTIQTLRWTMLDVTPISVMKTPCWLVVWNMTFVFHNIWNNPSYWLSYSSRWLLQRQPACATIKIMGISGHNWRSQPGCFTIDQRSLQTPMCFFSHLIMLVLSHMSLKKYYLPMILNISSNGGIHRFIIDKLIFSCLCWFDHLCRPFCMQVVTKDDATPSFTAGSLLPSGAVDDIPSSRLT